MNYIEEIYSHFNINKEERNLYTKFIKTWIGINSLSVHDIGNKYLINDDITNENKIKCKNKSIEECLLDNDCDIYISRTTKKKICLPKKSIKEIYIDSIIKNNILN
jgi:hypothetical protein